MRGSHTTISCAFKLRSMQEKHSNKNMHCHLWVASYKHIDEISSAGNTFVFWSADSQFQTHSQPNITREVYNLRLTNFKLKQRTECHERGVQQSCVQFENQSSTEYHDRDVGGSLRSVQKHPRVIEKVRPRPLPYTSFPLHFSLFFLSFD